MPDQIKGNTLGRIDPYGEVRRLLASEDAFGTTVLVLFFDLFGDEGLEWDPAVIRRELDEEIRGRMSETSFNRLMAAATILKTDLFTTSAYRFSEIANALVDSGPSGDVMEPASVAECAWAAVEARLIDDGAVAENYSPEVVVYVLEKLKDEGFMDCPSALRIVVGDAYGSRPLPYADDVELTNMTYAMQRERLDLVDLAVTDNMASLMAQVRSLPLKSGSTDFLAKSIGA